MKQGFGLAAALVLAGCSAADDSDYSSYFAHPSDPEVQALVFEQCLKASRPAGSTHYADQDETVSECSRQADDIARYCPLEDLNGCLPQYRRTRDDIRAVLPEEPTQ